MKKGRRRRAAAQPTSVPLGIYANHVDTGRGSCEIQIRLSQTVIPALDPPSVDVVEIVRVALPIQTAKVLAFQLLCNISVHEALLGPVNMIPALAPSMPDPQILGPDCLGRLAVIHAELFAPVPPAVEPVKELVEKDGGQPKTTTH